MWGCVRVIYRGPLKGIERMLVLGSRARGFNSIPWELCDDAGGLQGVCRDIKGPYMVICKTW